MANFTLVELHFEDVSLSADLPFGGSSASSDTDTETATDDETANDEGRLPIPGLAVVALLVVALAVGAVVKRRLGGEEPDVDVETAEDREADDRPVGVTVED